MFSYSANILFKVLEAKLGNNDFVCATNGWDHRREDYYPGVQINCEELKEHYPIIRRTKHSEGTLESLWLNETLFYQVHIDEKFQATNHSMKDYFKQ